ERERRAAKLRELLAQKQAELDRDMGDIKRLQESMGFLNPAVVATQNQLLQQQLSVVNNSIFSHTAQVGNLEVEIDKYKLDIELARDPSAREARAEEEAHKDEKLRKLEDQKQDLELAIPEANDQNKSDDNPTLKRLKRSLATVEEKLA